MRLNIQERGIIKGGFVEYSFVDDKVIYRGEVTARVIIFSRTFPFSGSKRMPAITDLFSETYRQVGVKKDLGLVIATVMEVVGDIAKVNLELPGYGSGSGILNLSGPMVVIQSLDVKAHVNGYSVEIVAA